MFRFRLVTPALAVGVCLGLLGRPAASAGEAPPPVQIPAVLSLGEALQIFHERGLDLLISDAAVLSAEGDATIAHQVFNPGWSFTFNHIFNYDAGVICGSMPPVGGSPEGCASGLSPNGYTLQLSDNNAIEDAIVGKRGLRIDIAHAALKAAKLSRADAERTMAFTVKQAYFQAVQARALRDFAKDVQEASNKTLDLNQLRYKAGAISEADVAKVETAKLEADQAVDQSEQTLRVAKVQLAFLLGARGGVVPDYQIQEDLIKFSVPGGLASASRETLLKEAFENRPDLKAIKAQEERAEASIRSARRSRFPDVAVTVGYFQQGTNTLAINPPSLILGLSGNLPVFYQQQGEVAKAEADSRTQTLQRAKLEAQVVSDIEQGFAVFMTTRRLVERMQTALLDRAKRARDLVAIQYQKGAASLLEFLDAQRTYTAINVEYFQDLTNYWTAVFQLEQAVGRDLR